jgi:hypothetical protein
VETGSALSSALAFLGGLSLGTAAHGLKELDERTEVFYRSMSTADYEKLSSTRQVPIHGESFVTRSFEYQVHLWLQTKVKRLDVLVVFLMEAGTEAAMRQYGLGAVATSAVELDPSLSTLESISKIHPSRKRDVIHIKGEYGALTYGLRDNSASTFNDRIITFFGIPL